MRQLKKIFIVKMRDFTLAYFREAYMMVNTKICATSGQLGGLTGSSKTFLK
jgi:hypothetical protein